jgi:hypothetical protein
MTTYANEFIENAIAAYTAANISRQFWPASLREYCEGSDAA